MITYNARDLLAMDEEALWGLPEDHMQVVFDDTTITTHTRATILSVYLWYPLVKTTEIPTSLTSDLHVQDTRFTSKSMIAYLNKVIWAIHAASGETIDPEHLSWLAFETVNRFYNVFTVRLSPYVATLSMFDLLEVMNHPTIAKANAEVQPTEHSIEKECYPAIESVLRDPNQLVGNPIAEAVKSETLKMGQVLQGVGPRGYTTDINADLFPDPIMKGYIQGIDDLYGAMIESRSGTKSLLYNKELLRGTEYFNRKTQLVAQYVQRLHPGDCGTPHLIDFPVTESIFKSLVGKYYLTEAGHLDHIRGNEKHLIGTTVKMRSVLGCTHPDSAGVCATCYGRLSFSIPKGTNIGQVSAVSMGDKITSSVLSTKHLDSTSRVEKFILGAKEKRFIRYGKEPETLYLNKDLHVCRKYITVLRDEVKNLADILMLPNIDGYPPTNASELSKLQISVDRGKAGVESEVLTVSLYNRKSSFSRELLEHIRQVRWTHDDKGNVLIDISGFDVNQSFLTLPFRHVNMYEVMGRIQTFLHSGSEQVNKRLGGQRGGRRERKNFLKNYRDPVQALVVFFNMLNEKLSINLVHCEVLVYAMMVVSSTQQDYRLPIPGIHGVFEKHNTLMLSRSMSGAMAYQKQDTPLITPGIFNHTNPNSHPYDTLLMGGRMD